MSGVGPRHCTEEGIQLPAVNADSAKLGTPGHRAWTSGQHKDPAGRENPLDGLGRGRQELGVEESSSSLSSSSEPPGLWLKPGNAPGYTALLPNSPVRPKGMSCCVGVLLRPGAGQGGRLEERVGLGLETAQTPLVARTPNSWLLLCLWGSLFYSTCCLDTQCRLPQKDSAILTALGGLCQGWAGPHLLRAGLGYP